jgi:hypothetical protein
MGSVHRPVVPFCCNVRPTAAIRPDKGFENQITHFIRHSTALIHSGEQNIIALRRHNKTDAFVLCSDLESAQGKIRSA